MKNKKIIYIIGSGHSGSTILNLILGSEKNSVSVGELLRIKYFYNKTPFGKHNKNIYDKNNFINNLSKCSCGDYVDKCSFWSSVLKNININNLYIPEESILEKLKFFIYMMLGKKNIKRNMKEDKKLYNEVFDLGYKNIVESSKTIRKLYYLINNTDLDIKVIHIVRDGRGVINSYEKKGNFFLKSYFDRIFVNSFYYIFKKNFIKKENYITLSYDKFAQNPEIYIDYLNKSLGLEIDKNNYIKDVNNEGFHNFAGNQLMNENIDGIYYDQSWKKRIPKWKQYVLNVLTYIPNKIWVYNNKL